MVAYGFEWLLDEGLPVSDMGIHGEARHVRGRWEVLGASCAASVPHGLNWRSGNDSLEPVFFVASTEKEIWLRFPHESDFRIDSVHRRIECHPTEGLNPDLLAHLIFNQVMPRVVAQQGRIVLHASSVGWDDMAIAFVGPSGAGKSSLAAAFCESGALLLADDGLALRDEGPALAIPAYPGLRLRLEAHWIGRSDVPSFRRKFLLNGEHFPFGFQATPVPLQAIFQLATVDEGDIDISRLPPRQAFEAIASNCFRLDAGDRERIAKEFGQISSLVDHTPIYRLSYPRDWGLMPAVIERVKMTIDRPAGSLAAAPVFH